MLPPRIQLCLRNPTRSRPYVAPTAGLVSRTERPMTQTASVFAAHVSFARRSFIGTKKPAKNLAGHRWIDCVCTDSVVHAPGWCVLRRSLEISGSAVLIGRIGLWVRPLALRHCTYLSVAYGLSRLSGVSSHLASTDKLTRMSARVKSRMLRYQRQRAANAWTFFT